MNRHRDNASTYMEGIFGGPTSGANVWGAIQRAKALGPGKKIVTVIIDSGLKYLNGDLYV